MASQMPAEAHRKILHANFKNAGLELLGSDMLGPEGLKKGNPVSLTMVCSSKKENDTFFAKLSAGGKALHPLKEEFFGTYGDLTDKYGIGWMFNYEAPNA